MLPAISDIEVPVVAYLLGSVVLDFVREQQAETQLRIKILRFLYKSSGKMYKSRNASSCDVIELNIRVSFSFNF